MRILVLTMTAAMILTATTLVVAPTASACDPRIQGLCVQCFPVVCQGRCVYGYDRDCLVYNPCDPRYCDPVWP